jgi:hypothetical protein
MGRGLVALFLISQVPSHAEASGPDFFRAKGLPAGQSLSLLQSPQRTSAVLIQIPADAHCLKNLGCQGGLSLEEFTSLSHEAQQARLFENPRWCRVEFLGTRGWIDGRFLQEDGCPGKPVSATHQTINFSARKSHSVSKGYIRGEASFSYRVRAGAGQLLAVTLKAKNPHIYFNVSPADSQEAMFIGSTTGNAMQRRLPADGDYLVEVYFMRSAARRGASGAFSLDIDLTGSALPALAASADALVAGTSFHATAMVRCNVPYNDSIVSCSAGVVRRGFDGTATVEIAWPQGRRRILFVKGEVAATDSTQTPTTTPINDGVRVRTYDNETFDIPDPFLTGG